MEWPRLPGFALPHFSLGTISRLTGRSGAGKKREDNLGTESEKERVGRERERSVAFKRTVYPSVKNVWIVSYPFVSRAIRFGCHSVMRTEGRRGNIQSQSLS